MLPQKRQVSPSSTQVGGFTLIELLTVIAIIGILAAIIIPVTGKVRARAKQATCLSNLRQLYTGCILFANDHKDALPMRDADPLAPPPAGEAPVNFWHRYIAPYIQNVSQSNDWRGKEGVYICPSDSRESPDLSYGFNGNLKSKRLQQIDGSAIMLIEALNYTVATDGGTSAQQMDGTAGFQPRHDEKGYVTLVNGRIVSYQKGLLPARTENPFLWKGIN